MSKPTNFSIEESLEVVWDALDDLGDDLTTDEQRAIFEERWDNVCLAMAWIKEALEGVELTPMGEQRLSGKELLATHKYTGQSALDLD